MEIMLVPDTIGHSEGLTNSSLVVACVIGIKASKATHVAILAVRACFMMEIRS